MPTPAASSRSASPTGRQQDAARRATAAAAVLATLPVKGRAPKTGYARERFGPAWTDDVTVDAGHNGCDTRNDVLRRDLVEVTTTPGSGGCAVLSGTLHDPYSATTVPFVRGAASSGAVQIDHLVALLDAWQKGARQLTTAQRTDLANDPLNLQATDGATNAAKGASDAASWLPPNKKYRCTYVARQVQVKAKYRLWVTAAERDAIGRVLAGCGAVVPQPTDAGSATGDARTTTNGRQDCHPLSNNGNCYRPGQMCAKRYRGASGTGEFGVPMTCVEQDGFWRWRTD